MIELKRKRRECWRGEHCNIWGAILPAAIGAVGSIIGSQAGGEDARTSTSRTSSMPTWTPEQRQLIWGSQGWEPQLPDFHYGALNYGQDLMGGYNPAFGAQQPMGFAPLLQSIMNPGGFGNPMDSRWATGQGGQQAGIMGLLGYGAGTPPPLLTNNPRYSGVNVDDPSRLYGRDEGYPRAPQEPTEAEQTQQQAPAFVNQTPPWQRHLQHQYTDPSAAWYEDNAAGAPTTHHLALPTANQQYDQFLRGLSGRNINDLSEQELAWLAAGGPQ